CLRYRDPRRFGTMQLTEDPAHHPLLAGLGPEPLSDDFDADYLAKVSRGRQVAIKQHLMNAQIVAGLGNIYANEALYRARIHPARPAGKIRRSRLRSEEHTSELQSRENLVCRLLLEKKKNNKKYVNQ